MNYKQGIFPITNENKYNGDLSQKIVYRSSWEYRLMEWLDISPLVKFWNSEDVVIPYVFPKESNNVHRYFVDFYVELINGSKFLLEVKPAKYQSIESFNKEKSEKVKYEYLKNLAKWTYAKQYAKLNKMKFCILEEKHIALFIAKVEELRKSK